MIADRDSSAFRSASSETAGAVGAPQAAGPTFPEPAVRVDAVGLLCPIPITRTAGAIRTLGPGAVLELRADDRVVLIDLPNWCRSWRHRYLGHREANGVLSLFVKKDGPRP